MNEFEDHKNIITMVSRAKDFTVATETMCDDTANLYEYLVTNHLLVKGDDFTNIVMDIYMSLLKIDEIPALSSIEDYIVDENVTIISNFFREYGYDEITIHHMIVRYVEDISYYHYDEIKTSLTNMGVPYIEGMDDLIQTKDFKNSELVKEVVEKKYFPQQILFYEFML
ncbi:MAG: hypothetical protein RR420_01405 [Anaerovoracaceae bacterium]